MLHASIKALAALALGSFALGAPALAASPLALNPTPQLFILAQDEENAEVWHDLRPDVTPPPAAVGKEESKGPAMEPPKEEGSGGGAENEEVWRDLRPDVTPPPAATGE